MLHYFLGAIVDALRINPSLLHSAALRRTEDFPDIP